MFSKHLKRARLAAGRTQSELAEALNISPQSISKWEKDLSVPGVDMLPQIAEFLGCPINAFFSEFELEVFERLCKNKPTLEDENELLWAIVSGLQGEGSDAEKNGDEKSTNDENQAPVELIFAPRVYEILQNQDKLSCALLQKELKIGYGLAAEIMDALLGMGVIKRDPKSKTHLVEKEKLSLLERFL